MSEPATVASSEHTREGRTDRIELQFSDGRTREFVTGMLQRVPPLVGMPEHEAISAIGFLSTNFRLVEVVRE